MSSIDALAVRKRLGRKEWAVPVQFGPDGWRLDRLDRSARIIATVGPTPQDDEDNWLHVSISRPSSMPTYEDLTMLHKVFWPDGYSYQIFAPPSQHVNIHNYALHLFGKPDGSAQLPEFGAMGTI